RRESAAEAEKREICGRCEAQGKTRILPRANPHPRSIERGVPTTRRRLCGLEKSLADHSERAARLAHERTRQLSFRGRSLPEEPAFSLVWARKADPSPAIAGSG